MVVVIVWILTLITHHGGRASIIILRWKILISVQPNIRGTRKKFVYMGLSIVVQRAVYLSCFSRGGQKCWRTTFSKLWNWDFQWLLLIFVKIHKVSKNSQWTSLKAWVLILWILSKPLKTQTFNILHEFCILLVLTHYSDGFFREHSKFERRFRPGTKRKRSTGCSAKH